MSSRLLRLVEICVSDVVRVSGATAEVAGVSMREERVENSASRSSSVDAVVDAARDRVDLSDLLKARRSCFSAPESFLGGFVRRTFVRERRSRICFFMDFAGSESSIAADSASISSDSSSSTMSSSTGASSVADVSVVGCDDEAFMVAFVFGEKPKIVGLYSLSGR